RQPHVQIATDRIDVFLSGELTRSPRAGAFEERSPPRGLIRVPVLALDRATDQFGARRTSASGLTIEELRVIVREIDLRSLHDITIHHLTPRTDQTVASWTTVSALVTS